MAVNATASKLEYTPGQRPNHKITQWAEPVLLYLLTQRRRLRWVLQRKNKEITHTHTPVVCALVYFILFYSRTVG